jgi:hypothetical protein
MSPISWVRVHKEIASIAGIVSLFVALLVSLGWSTVSPSVRLKNHEQEAIKAFESIQAQVNQQNTSFRTYQESQAVVLDSLFSLMEPLMVSACITISVRDAMLLRLKCDRVIAEAKERK